MIELDRWESQFVWLAKHWVLKEIEDLSLEDALKNLWGKRCGMYAEQVELGFVASFLLDLIQKVDSSFNLRGFMSNMAPVQYFETKYTDNKSYAERICWVCLYNYLSILQTREHDENDELFDLIKLQPLELDLFIEEEENDN